MKPRILVIIALVACSSQRGVFAQEDPTSNKKTENLRATPSCSGDPWAEKLSAPPISRTSLLISPDGRYRAYAENESIPASHSANGGTSECRSTTKLFIIGPKGEKSEPVLVLNPSKNTPGNSIDLVDWSPVGHRLLFLQGDWMWGSDFGGVWVRIYDADSGKVSSESLFDEAFRRYVGKNCVAVFAPMGFSSSGKPIVSTSPYVDEENVPQKDSCVAKQGVWLVDLVTLAVIRLRDNYKVQRYGKKGS